MSALITGFVDIFRFHKLKIAFAFVSFLFFLLVLFPFDDMSDFVTAQVAKMTQNQIFLKFSDPGLSIFPAPGLKLKDVYVETPYAPPLKADALSISPSLSSLLAFKTGVSLDAQSILGGDISMSAYSSKMKDNNQPSQKISIDAEDLDVQQVSQLAGSPVRFKGRIGLTSEAEIDLTWKEQPLAKITINGKSIQVPPDTVPTMMGPLALPDLTFSKLEIEGELKQGKFIIEKGVLGSEQDDLNGTITGEISVSVQNNGGNPTFVPGAYDLKLRLNVRETLEKKVGLFLIICDSVKKKNGPFINYPCGLSASGFGVPPRARAL